MQLEIICDGGARNNQDVIKREAYGSYLIQEEGEKPIYAHFEYGRESNNEAEYMALRDALHALCILYPEPNHLKIIDLTIKTDSQLVEGQLTKGWRANPRLFPRVLEVRGLLKNFKSWKIEKITGIEMKAILGH